MTPPQPRTRTGTFDELLAEGASVPTEGWDFSWFEGRATEARPSWGYATTVAGRLGAVDGPVLDVQTGGGEVLAFALGRASRRPPLVAATEGWPPNVRRAAHTLRPYGAAVVAAAEDAPLPFADGSFSLVTSRHPVRPLWDEIARVLRPGGAYLAQHVGPASAFELVEYFLGPLPEGSRTARDPGRERRDAEAAGLEVVELRAERLRMEFFDIAAVVHFLRKVIWMVPGFTVEAYRPRLRELHERIEAEGPFVAHSSRHLVEARRPGGPGRPGA
ncbi:methyltransferase type 11 [Streptomyces albogriseolus]|uniref:class I SAM-dependent methyltransferase n=1 Tax=Streptomyces albogriseolus TaxID=1887 RepID=UPI001675FE0B|nr:methyltransferase domain-containing protein [Streptomyces viridodiastaticus]MCX4568938.1 class I SAM-dependent methyltransferase [Streptomyces viridodiastaticus]GHG36774.1 methyltransferase type 11 [Streptomyces viridodiastaticus]